MIFKLSTLSLVGIVGLTTFVGHAQAAPPDLIFDCSRAPEVCTNMCWAVRCANPVFPVALTFDWPDKAKEDARRKSAGCQKGNKCNKGKTGPGHRGTGYESCDEYPFASTKEADRGHQVSRCVPGKENSYQGGKLSGLQKRWKKEGKTGFKIGFGNPGAKGVKFCQNQACKNDGWQVQDGKISKRDEQPLFKYYRTRADMVFASLEPVSIPSNFTREFREADKVDETFYVWTEVDEDGEQRLIQDTVVEELAWDHFLN
ncbi:hypothetical protein CRV24_009596 [Beauveria bassiana]|uniref:Deoxyribonuclease NucA/NucB domain-containing protein n=1 Tax=Beauveria bassiana (strain ARSEF 2860) TaxID=655819 RepID=J4UHZ3_BEAB2|nr:uncharacterized protein BBA_07988 [Beauveria bassiana ARSEF 2860]EJP62977.1 hypothetical protein BBA_07988 [Beauveria bassiana ARSEF 2860]KAF1730140.1 hypothetical protein CRV24_009596 [Beauveria bassiana]KAH8707874.1 hypothetical protein HC256_010036 [Beauveria bassiana]